MGHGGMFCALQLEGCWFESTSSHCVATLDKLLTDNCPRKATGTMSHISYPGGIKANEPALGQRTIIIIIVIIINLKLLGIEHQLICQRFQECSIKLT